MFKKIRKFYISLFYKYSSDIFFLFLSYLFTTTITLIVWPVILRNLSIEDYGRFQFLLTIQSWFLIFTATYISSGSQTAIARNFKGTFLYVFFYRLKLMFILAILGIIASFYLYFQGNYSLFSLAIIMLIYLAIGYLPKTTYLFYLTATKNFKEKAIWEIFTTFFISISSLLVAYYTHNVVLFAITQLGISAFAGWLGFIYVIYKNDLFNEYKRGNIDKRCVSYGIKMIPFQLLNITSKKLSSFLIGSFFGFSYLAQFQTANNLREKFAAIPKIANPLLRADFSITDKQNLTQVIKSKLKPLFIASFLFTILVLICGYFYISIFLPQNYQIAKTYFTILSFTFPFSIVTLLFSIILDSHLLHKEINKAGLITNSVKIFLILIFGYFWKTIGICLAITISAWISFFIYYKIIFSQENKIAYKEG